MILSYHPIIVGDQNRLCAGRAPDASDRRLMKAADAVILPQGCRAELFQIARQHCRHVFPNYDARFRYAGKLAQMQLFQSADVPCPNTMVVPDTRFFSRERNRIESWLTTASFPLVFKFDWGGEGETVWLVRSRQALQERVDAAVAYEKTGQRGFLLQEYIPAGGRSLRVVVIGNTFSCYWRVQQDGGFYSNLAKGARVEADVSDEIRDKAVRVVSKTCRHHHIDLAAFDLLVSGKNQGENVFLIEINWFFGRSGLGGSDAFYQALRRAVAHWLRGLALALPEDRLPIRKPETSRRE